MLTPDGDANEKLKKLRARIEDLEDQRENIETAKRVLIAAEILKPKPRSSR
jgi:hypothetical protein